MHDIKAIRASAASKAAGSARRGDAMAAEVLIERDAKRRRFLTEAEEKTAQQKRLGGEMHRAAPEQQNMLRVKLLALKEEIAAAETLAQNSALLMNSDLASFPNLPAPDVPDGLDETYNVVVHARGTVPAFGFSAMEHDTLALKFGYDPDAAAAIAGARFAVLTGPLARLHRALGNWMLSRNSAAGWTEVVPPVLVKREAMFGTGQLPKFEDDAFQTTDGRFLIPTAEVSLTNLIRGKVLDRDHLPLRFTALTPCFRAEAGSAGRDTRGLIRQHQFDKVELVSIVADADAARDEHEHMTEQAESLLDALGLPYRRMLLCAGDMGFSARKTYDLEVWLPGQGQYREISSVSDCGDFQARRMDVDEPKGGRFRTKGVKGTHFVHTLNGSALAVGRTLVAVIENHQRADGSVAVPEVLAPFMGGVTELRPQQ
jgi:seryl-tRNA synthetase